MEQRMNPYELSFEQAYNSLNEEQRRAVDTLEGPVMVVAGPGTGKTQILATRVGNILRQTDARAHNILCLTFTEAGAIAMRRRLVQIIGPTAHEVHIFTFHSFCNQVIKDNLGRFNNYRELDILSDLERVAIYDQLIEQLADDHILKGLKSDNAMIREKLSELFDLMKRENISEATFHAQIKAYLERRFNDPEDKDLRYLRRYREFAKGDLKQVKWDDLNRRMNELAAGVDLFAAYEALLKSNNRFDYTDMILWVLNEFKKDDQFLLNYQERYQYFLVDEFQDTNGSQNDILNCLIAYWGDEANVFVVGDDDQAIFKFQGANIDNIIDFRSSYRPAVIDLVKNYRSSQKILDVAGTLIQNNPDRLSNAALIAAGPNKDVTDQIKIKSYPNVVQEEAQLVEFLAQEYAHRNSLSHCAVIYRKHAQVSDIVQVLEKRGLPLNIVNRVNALKLPLIKNISNILAYLEGELSAKGQNNRQLFEIMHYDFFGIRSSDISKIMTRIYRDFRGEDTENIGLDEAIVSADYLSGIELNDAKAILRLGDLLAKWIGDIHNVTLQTLFQKILNEGGVLKAVLQSSEKTWLLQVLTTMFNLIKNESDKNPDFSLADFNLMITQMVDNKISLPVTKVVSAAKGVHFLTAHRAKGLEFENVFVIGATEDKWNGRSYNKSFAYPDTVNRDSDTNDEDERRLMYVAMTRAEKRLELSFSRQKEDGKEIGPAKFIDEIANHDAVSIIEAGVNNDALNDYQYHRLLLSTKTPELLDHDLIDSVLGNFSLSVTALNKYLKCPISFYFDTILQVPTARSKYMGFGRAVHFALENIYKKYNAKESVDAGVLINYFNKGMLDHKSHFTPKELKDMTAYGKQILPLYFDKHMGYNEQILSYEMEYRIDNVQFKGVPIKGLIDRVDIYKDRVEVVDYKTGNPANKKKELKAINLADSSDMGGDYWRQIVFYKILLMQDVKMNKEMIRGVMEFVEPDKNTGEFTIKDFYISPDEIEAIGTQILDVWTKIHNHEFSKGCGEETCNWCEFVKNDYVFSDQVVFEADEEMWIDDPEIA